MATDSPERIRRRLYSWIIEGKVIASSYPCDDDHLHSLCDHGVRAIVTLHEQPLDEERLAAHSLEALHIPVRDFEAPSLQQINGIVAFVERRLAAGKGVAVHCAAGLGRTGTAVACYLVHEGYSPTAALAHVRSKRPGSVQTDEQQSIVYEYARSRKNSPQTATASFPIARPPANTS